MERNPIKTDNKTGNDSATKLTININGPIEKISTDSR